VNAPGRASSPAGAGRCRRADTRMPIGARSECSVLSFFSIAPKDWDDKAANFKAHRRFN